MALKASKIMMSDFTNPALYCLEYKMAFEIALGMIPGVSQDRITNPPVACNATATELHPEGIRQCEKNSSLSGATLDVRIWEKSQS